MNAPAPTVSSGPTATSALASQPASPEEGEAERARVYVDLADEVISVIGELTRTIAGIGISLAGKPDRAIEARGTVEAVKGSFELARQRLNRADPPPGYEEVHQTLLDALSFYMQASAALLPDSQTGMPDYPGFQELMLLGGKNTHAAGAQFSDLTPQRD